MVGGSFKTPLKVPDGLEGYLSKQGGGKSVFGRKSWKVRYFVLKNGVLTYYKDKNEAQGSVAPIGSFHVLSIMSIKAMPHKDSKLGHTQWHREIVLPERSLVVCCDQEDIMLRWVDAINAHVRYQRKIEHMKKIQREARMIQDELQQQMSCSIMSNVLKRWQAIEFQRALEGWRMKLMVSRYGKEPALDISVAHLRQKCDSEKKHQMLHFTEGVKEKWEHSVVDLQQEIKQLREEMIELKENNMKLRDENNSFREGLQSINVQEQLEVQRIELVALVEASGRSDIEDSNRSLSLMEELEMQVSSQGVVIQNQEIKLAALEEQTTMISSAHKQSEQLKQELKALKDEMKQLKEDNHVVCSDRSIKTPAQDPAQVQHGELVSSVVGVDAAGRRALETQISNQESRIAAQETQLADLAHQASLAASAQEQASQQIEHINSLAASLEAAQSALENLHGEVGLLRAEQCTPGNDSIDALTPGNGNGAVTPPRTGAETWTHVTPQLLRQAARSLRQSEPFPRVKHTAGAEYLTKFPYPQSQAVLPRALPSPTPLDPHIGSARPEPEAHPTPHSQSPHHNNISSTAPAHEVNNGLKTGSSPQTHGLKTGPSPQTQCTQSEEGAIPNSGVHVPVGHVRTPTASTSPKADSCGWIARYKAIANSLL